MSKAKIHNEYILFDIFNEYLHNEYLNSLVRCILSE